MAAAISVPKPIRLAPPGTPYFKEAITQGIAGENVEVLTDTVPAGLTRNLLTVIVICPMAGYFFITANNLVIGSGRTGPGEQNVTFSFSPWRPLAALISIKVVFRLRCNAPQAPVEVYLQASDESTVTPC